MSRATAAINNVLRIRQRRRGGELRELGDAVDELRDLGAEELGELLRSVLGVCAGGSLSALVLDVKTFTVSGRVTLNGANPVSSSSSRSGGGLHAG